MRIQGISRIVFAALLATAAFGQPANKTPVIAMQNFIHSVANLEKSVAFYRDVFGLELTGELRPPNGNPTVLGLVDARGAQFRAGTFKIPGAGFGLELTEFTGIPNKTAVPRHSDPGAADLMLRVRDVDAAFAALKKAGATIISTSGAPVKIGPPTGNVRSIFARDPDGYVLEVIQTPPAPDAPSGGNVHSAGMGLTVDDMETTMKFYRDILGFELKGTAEFASNPAVLDMVGAPAGGQFRQLAGSVPATNAHIEFYEFKNVPRTPFRLRIPDPGSPALSLRVNGLDALLKRVKDAGYKVITLGGVPIGLGATRNVFVEDPNGVAVELIEAVAK
jgi:catechol 2,3-dioxygenase-like lactoylglutathione lyase family enzyme